MSSFPNSSRPASHASVLAACAVMFSLVAASAQAQSTATATTSTSWNQLSKEGQLFLVSGTKNVRYGTGSRWVYKSVRTVGLCSTGYFGSDPAKGSAKTCQVMAAAPAPAPAPAPA
ncbi:MAG: hypothetical protein KIT86_23810, partial [Hydrogenophaga sp.]|nr:hypothetical protein [Hydrogenophaga sp.]